MQYQVKDIAQIIHANAVPQFGSLVSYLLIDSRRIVFPGQSLFFAISGPRRDGHRFIGEVYERGVRNFVVRSDFDHAAFPGANFLVVPDVLRALQQLAAWHRHQFNIPVIGITGSNGKTIVKEWLYQLLQDDQLIVRSPRSYNSQLGVPLSVWPMNGQHTLGIFEAGISTVNEMRYLADVIQPTIGVFTNIAGAHSEGFADNREKALEKAKLFSKAGKLVYCKDALMPVLDPSGVDRDLFSPEAELFGWSRELDADFRVMKEIISQNLTRIEANYGNASISFTIPFTDRISVDNVITCICVMLQMGYTQKHIQERINKLQAVDMRMQLKKAINNCYVLNDSYSNDTASLWLALDYLIQQSGNYRTTLILSDILQSGIPEEQLYTSVAEQVAARGIGRVIGIGSAISSHRTLFDKLPLQVMMFSSTDIFLQQLTTQQFRDEYILLKGARVFEFERISAWLEQKVHQTVMEINLSAMVHNLKAYQEVLQPSTKLMAMVKAFSYGSGSAEVARVLQFHKVDYLAVAYADEGVELRKAGISLPIMVMNTDEAAFDALITYNLEPEIYSAGLYRSFNNYLNSQGILQFPVHIKFNTGMNRLGFEVNEAEELAAELAASQAMVVRSLFSHLVASEAAEHDAFTAHQVRLFQQACETFRKYLPYDFIRHIANSAAIFRNPAYQFDMVRLGIGLYGVDSAAEQQVKLETVASLYSTIAQLREVKAGESVGYNRKGVVHRDSLIATVRIGYADGFSRRLGNGAGSMLVNNIPAPVIGNVCMDMTMIDVTGIEAVKEGDRVEIFGRQQTVQQVAAWAGTIAYEVLTGISQRVKRVYLEE